MKSLFILMLVTVATVLHGQIQVTGSVLATAGASGTAGDMAVCSTLGEAAIFSTSSGGLYFGQGFHTLTPGRITSTVRLPERAVEVVLFPNPSTGIVHVRSEADITEFRWFAANGQGAGQLSATDGDLDLTHLPAGTYYLQARLNGQLHALGQIVLTK